MEALKEITVWKGVARQPNHTYLFDGERAVAYIKWHQGKPIYFNNPGRLDRRGRKFVKADIKLFGETKVKSSLLEVKGSKGNSYWVDPMGKTCTCPGFTFRGKCKHITQLGDSHGS